VVQLSNELGSLNGILKTQRLSNDERVVLDALIKQVTKTRDEVIRLSHFSAQLTRLNTSNSNAPFYEYNNSMLVKYCHLMIGRIDLIREHDYFAAIVVERSMYEIVRYLRYFFKKPSEIIEYKKDNRNPKFSMKKVIDACLTNVVGSEGDYEHYCLLCSLNHPSSKVFLNLTASEIRERNNVILINSTITPSFDKDGLLTNLVSLLRDNMTLLDIEYQILKVCPTFQRDDKLLDETYKMHANYSKKVFWGQEGVKLQYAMEKKKRIKELSRSS